MRTANAAIIWMSSLSAAAGAFLPPLDPGDGPGCSDFVGAGTGMSPPRESGEASHDKPRPTTSGIIRTRCGGSSNGRTSVFGAVSLGSSPSPPAIFLDSRFLGPTWAIAYFARQRFNRRTLSEPGRLSVALTPVADPSQPMEHPAKGLDG